MPADQVKKRARAEGVEALEVALRRLDKAQEGYDLRGSSTLRSERCQDRPFRMLLDGLIGASPQSSALRSDEGQRWRKARRRKSRHSVSRFNFSAACLKAPTNQA